MAEWSRIARFALTCGLAACAYATNLAHVPMPYGLDLLLGSLWAMVALVWLGPVAGVTVAVVGGIYGIALWHHPYALIILAVEVASVALIREWLPPDGERLPLAAADGIFWVALGIPLVAVFYGWPLAMDWTEVALVGLKQSINGVLNAALAGAFVMSVRRWRPHRGRIPIRDLLFTTLMLGILVPALFVSTWQNLRLSEAMERDVATVLGAATGLALARIGELEPPVTPADARAVLPSALAEVRRLLPGVPTISLLIEPPAGAQERPTTGMEIAPPDDSKAANIVRWRQGQFRIYSRVAPIGPRAWLVAEMGGADALAGLRRAQLELFGQLGLITLVALFAAFYLARRVSRPIAALAREAAALPGHLSGPAPPRHPSTGPLREIAEMGDAFGRMEIALRDTFQRLAREQERYRLLVEHQSDLFVQVDAGGCFQYASPSYCRLFGLDARTLTGRHFMPLVHPQDQDATLAAWRSLFRPPHTCRVDQRAMTPEGWRWIQWSDTALLDAEGQVTAVVAIGRDITDRKEAEEELQRSEARFRAVFEQALIGMAILGEGGHARYVNTALERILGRDSITLLGQCLDEFAHPDDRQSDSVLFEQLVAGARRSYRLVKRYLKPDGSLVWADLTVSLLPVGEGASPVPLALLVDITRRRRAEDAQADAERAVQRYSGNLQDFSRLTATYNPSEDNLQSLLAYGCQALGVNCAALWRSCDQGLRVIATVGPTPLMAGAVFSAPSLLPEVNLKGGMDYPVFGDSEHPVFGSDLCFHVQMPLAWSDADGREQRGVLAFADRRTVPEFNDPERHILRLLSQRIATVLREQAVLEGLLQARQREVIGHLAGGFAHDFNNVLGVVMTNFHLLERLLPQGTNKGEAHEILEETMNAIKQAKVVTSGLLSLGREGKIQVDACNLSSLVAGFAPLVRRLLPPRVELELEVEPEVWATTHSAMLQAALLNLALNGRDAMGGRGCLTLRVARVPASSEPAPTLGVIGAGSHVALEVADTGIGMTDAVRPRIFEPLFSTKQRGKGTGLGLFMVREFVLRTGGAIEVESAEGGGSRFLLLFPAASPTASTSATRTPATKDVAPTGERTARILLVDDDPVFRAALLHRLRGAGHQVEQAADGAQALDLIAGSTGFDLVLSDIFMPVLDGLELYSALCCDYPDLPVVLMTGDANAADQAMAIDPLVQVLIKPFDGARLDAVVRAALAQPLGAGSGTT